MAARPRNSATRKALTVALLALVTLVVSAASHATAATAETDDAAAATAATAHAAVARGAAAPAGLMGAQAEGTLASLTLILSAYASADPSHDAGQALRVRALASGVSARIAQGHSSSIFAARDSTAAHAARRSAVGLERTLRTTRVRLRPWPLPQTVQALSAATQRALATAGVRSAIPAKPYDAIDRLLREAASAGAARDAGAAQADAAGAYALFAVGPGRRLQQSNPALGAETSETLWQAVTSAGDRSRFGGVRRQAEAAVQTAANALGDVSVSRVTPA